MRLLEFTGEYGWQEVDHGDDLAPDALVFVAQPPGLHCIDCIDFSHVEKNTQVS